MMNQMYNDVATFIEACDQEKSLQNSALYARLIEEEYKDNATIQNAFDEWEEANKRFRVILALAERK